jgi:hypothetical protein
MPTVVASPRFLRLEALNKIADPNTPPSVTSTPRSSFKRAASRASFTSDAIERGSAAQSWRKHLAVKDAEAEQQRQLAAARSHLSSTREECARVREELRAARAEARDFQRYRRVMAQTLGGVEAEVAALRRAAPPEAAEARSEAARRRERSVEAFVGRQAAARAERHRLRTWEAGAAPAAAPAAAAPSGADDDAEAAERACDALRAVIATMRAKLGAQLDEAGGVFAEVEALRASLAARPPPPPGAAAAAAAEAAASEAAAAAAANADAAPVGNAGLERALALALSRNAELEGQLAAEAEAEARRPAGEMKPRLIASLEATAAALRDELAALSDAAMGFGE